MVKVITWIKKYYKILTLIIIILVGAFTGVYQLGKYNGHNEQMFITANKIVEEMGNDQLTNLGNQLIRLAIYNIESSANDSMLYDKLFSYFYDTAINLKELSNNVTGLEK